MSAKVVSEHVWLIDAPYHGERGVLGTYLVKGEEALLVDPGPSVSIPHVTASLEDLPLNPDSLRYIAVSHVHLDHAGGSWKLLEMYPGSTILVQTRGAPHMIDTSKLETGARALFGDGVRDYGEIRGVPHERVEETRNGLEIDLGGMSIRVIWTPGHATHHQCFYVPVDGLVIAGDAAGLHSPETGVTLPTTPPPFNPERAVESLDRLIALRPETLCYGHFGPAENAVERLRQHKAQLILWGGLVREGLEAGLGPLEIWAIIRERDPNVSGLIGLDPARMERSPMISLLGFIRYHEWLSAQGGSRKGGQ